MSNPNENPPGDLGGVKVKIKDGNTGHYITYDDRTDTIATSTNNEEGFVFEKTIVDGKHRLAFRDGYYLASGGPTGGVVRSNHTTTPEWTYTSTQKMYIHDNTDEHIAVDNHGRLSIGPTGSDVEFE